MQQRRISIEEICNRLKPKLGSKIDKLYFRYVMSESVEEREEIVHFLNALYQKNFGGLLTQKILLEPPKKELIDGEYELATIVYDEEKLKYSLFAGSISDSSTPNQNIIGNGTAKSSATFSITSILGFLCPRSIWLK